MGQDIRVSSGFDEFSVAVEPSGLRAPAVWFAGGRIAARLTAYGTLDEVAYFGAQPIDRGCFFKAGTYSPYERLFCPYLLVDRRAWQMEFAETRIYPGGYTSHLRLPEENVEILHSLVLLNDALHFSFKVLENRDGKPLAMRLSLHDHLCQTPPGREWGEWFEDSALGAQIRTITDPEGTIGGYYADLSAPRAETNAAASPNSVLTWLGVLGTAPVRTRAYFSGRRHFDLDATTESSAAMCVLFGKEEASFRARAVLLQQEGVRIGEGTVAEWRRTLSEAPAVTLGNPTVESFFRQAGLITDALKPTDLAGGMRASCGHYWVWGWDTIIYCDSELCAGRANFVRDALELYRRTVHPHYGIGHKFSEKMEVLAPQALCAQGLYLNMLYQYFAYTGDEAAVRAFYPFARDVFQRILTAGFFHGLFPGSSLWPDHPRFAGHANAEGEVSDRDLSIFNNALFYQSARAMEHLAGVAGDLETARQARATWQSQDAAFREHFWDAEKQYWIDSLESGSLDARRSYPAYAVPWINPFARELAAGREEACAAFLQNHHACAGGIRPYPVWDQAFNGDGNQMAQWYPTGGDLYFLKMMAATGRQPMLERWLGWVEEFWHLYTVPEGLTLEAENDGPHRPDCPGGKQPFAVKPWRMAIIHTILGLELDGGGLTLCPALDRPVHLTRLPFQGREYSVSTTGEGLHFERLSVNGKIVVGSCKIPIDHCGERQQHVEVVRTRRRPEGPVILSADGASLSELRLEDRRLRVHVAAPGSVRVWLHLPDAEWRVSWKGGIVPHSVDEKIGRGSVLLCPDGLRLDGELRVEATASPP